MRFEARYQPGLARSLWPIVELLVLLVLLVGCGGNTGVVTLGTDSDVLAADDRGQDSVEDEASFPDIASDADSTANPDLYLDSSVLPDEVSLSDWVSDA